MLVKVHHLILTIAIARTIFLVLGEGLRYGINGSFGSPEKKVRINSSKANTKICLSLHYNGDNSNLFVNGKGNTLSLKLTIKMITFQLSFV